ncbi:MAG: hypothetical protein ACJ796_14495 [Gemmatimonadaceae bacterium]
MTRTELERLLGRSNDTTDFTQARGVFGAEYTMARIANDTSTAGAERAQHATVTTNVGFHRDTLFKIRIRRDKPLPRFVE